ncbi:MAG: InlB B-repeat-containing protein [Proteobacteria bacterium]|nr:InlB B-repeat-containing protein [Pseudomonadota bacterium]
MKKSFVSVLSGIVAVVAVAMFLTVFSTGGAQAAGFSCPPSGKTYTACSCGYGGSSCTGCTGRDYRSATTGTGACSTCTAGTTPTSNHCGCTNCSSGDTNCGCTGGQVANGSGGCMSPCSSKYGTSCTDHTTYSSCSGTWDCPGTTCICTRTCDESQSCTAGYVYDCNYCGGYGRRYKSCNTESASGCKYASYGACEEDPSHPCCTNTCPSTPNTTTTQNCNPMPTGTTAGTQTCNGYYGGNNCTGSCSGCTSFGTCCATACSTGYKLSGTGCQTCVACAVGDTCGCPANQHWDGTKCVADCANISSISCTDSSVPNYATYCGGTASFTCPSAWTVSGCLTNQSCSATNTVPHATATNCPNNGTKCGPAGTCAGASPCVATQCESGYYLYNGTCNDCPQYATCDGTPTVVCDSPLVKTGSGASITCACPSGTSATGAGGPLGGSGGCKCATAGEGWDPVNKECVLSTCTTGGVSGPAQWKDGVGNCQPCPVSDGDVNVSDIYSDPGATSITQCYKLCKSQPTDWKNANQTNCSAVYLANNGANLNPTAQVPSTDSNKASRIYSNAAGVFADTKGSYTDETGTYPGICKYSVTSMPGYDPRYLDTPTPSPTCALRTLNIGYFLLATPPAAGLPRPDGMTVVTWPTTFDIVRNGTGVTLPDGTGVVGTNCPGASFAGWYTLPGGPPSPMSTVTDWTEYVPANLFTSIPPLTLANCADCKDWAFYAKMVCNSGYHYISGTPTADPCNICAPNQVTIKFDGNTNTGGAAPANQICAYGTACALSGRGTLVKSGNVFAGWCTNADPLDPGTCYSPAADVQNLAIGNATITLYAKWSDNVIECNPGTYYPGSGNSCSDCEANYYCPGGTFDKGIGEQIKNSCATDTAALAGGPFPKSAAKSGTINDCYKDCSPANTCASPKGDSGGTQHVNDAACGGYTITSCATGRYLDTAATPNRCALCPAPAAGQQNGLTNGCNDGGAITNCFVVCKLPVKDSATTNWIHNPSGAEADYNAKFDGTKYPECAFTIDCKTTFQPQGNGTPSPTCTQGNHVTYVLNGGEFIVAAQPNPEYFTTLPLPLPISSAPDQTTVRQPKRDCDPSGFCASAFAGWFDAAAAGPMPSIPVGVALDENNNVTIYAHWRCMPGYYVNPAVDPNKCVAVGIGYWAPGNDDNNFRYKCPANFSTQLDNSSSIQSCYVDEYVPTDNLPIDLPANQSGLDPDCDAGWRRSTATYPNPPKTNCVNNTCDYAMPPPTVTVTYSEAKPITAKAGFYYDPAWLPTGTNDLCRPVTSGWYSPDHTAGRTECPGHAADPVKIGSVSPFATIADCYQVCPAKAVGDVSHALTVTNSPATGAKINYDTASASYPLSQCLYTITCVQSPQKYCDANKGTPAIPGLLACEFCDICPAGQYCDPDPKNCPAGYTDANPGVASIDLCRKNCAETTVANGKMIPNSPYVVYGVTSPHGTCSYTLHCGAGYKPNAAGTACVKCDVGEICPCDPYVEPSCDTCDPGLWCCPDADGKCDPICLATGKPCWPDPLQCSKLGTGVYLGYWPLSIAGASAPDQCYANCPPRNILDGATVIGTENPLKTPVYYANICAYPTDCIPGVTDPNSCACKPTSPTCIACTAQYITCAKGYVLDGCQCIPEKCSGGEIKDPATNRCKPCPPGAVSNTDPIPNGFKAVQQSYAPVPGYADVWGYLYKAPVLPSSIGAANTKCLYCGAGLQTNAARTGCEICPPGTYRTTGMMPFFDKCQPCPPHNIKCPANDDPTCDAGYVAQKQADGTTKCAPTGGCDSSLYCCARADGTCDPACVGKPFCDPFKQMCVGGVCDLGEYGYGTISSVTGQCVLYGCLGPTHVSADGMRCDSNYMSCTMAGGAAGYSTWNGRVWTACAAGQNPDCATAAGGVGTPGRESGTPGGQTCNVANAATYSADGLCTVLTCVAGYHTTDGAACVSDTKSCTLANAAAAIQTWTNGGWGACAPTACNYGYHISANKTACVKDSQSCAIANGTGSQDWVGDDASGGWGPCYAVSCNPGFTTDAALSAAVAAGNPCGACDNANSVLGEPAVSAWNTSGACSIKSCVYQDQKYALEYNECVPICIPSSDDTGTIVKWNAATNTCDITCGPGYMKW